MIIMIIMVIIIGIVMMMLMMIMMMMKIIKKFDDINKDETHPLHTEIDQLKLVTSGRFAIPRAKTNRYLNSFIPSAVKAFNDNNKRN